MVCITVFANPGLRISTTDIETLHVLALCLCAVIAAVVVDLYFGLASELLQGTPATAAPLSLLKPH